MLGHAPPTTGQGSSIENIKLQDKRSTLSFDFVLALFATRGYPKIYYNLTGDNRPFSQLPIITSINSGTIMILLITYVIMLIGAKIYNTKVDLMMRPGVFSEKAQSWSLVVVCLLGIGITAGFVLNM